MDNVKTGLFIRQLRQEKGFTQLDLAEKLHVTDRAVSKWERGLCAPDIGNLEPLSEALGCTLAELITGERQAETKPDGERVVREVLVYSEGEIGKSRRRARTVVAVTAAVALALILAALAWRYGPAVFQRGNPIPYLTAAAKLDGDTPYVRVKGGGEVYITRHGECPELIAHIEETKNVTYTDQGGSVYIFTAPEGNRVMFQTSVYWRRYQVWELLHPPTRSTEMN